jgi:pimeloyl-ACP methyl ester carboxylesterase
VRTISFWYERTDDAPVIILLHNVGTSSSNFRPLIPVLFRAGFQVLAVDMRGHGRSRDLSPEIYDAMRSRQNSAFHSMKYDVEAAIQWLQDEQGIKPERISFVGGQFGSTLAIQALARGWMPLSSQGLTSWPTRKARLLLWVINHSRRAVWWLQSTMTVWRAQRS